FGTREFRSGSWSTTDSWEGRTPAFSATILLSRPATSKKHSLTLRPTRARSNKRSGRTKRVKRGRVSDQKMQLYADEDFPLRATEEFRSLGHDVLTVQEDGRGSIGTPDSDVLTRAHE